MGIGPFASLIFTLTQLSLAVLGRDISSSERSFQTKKPSANGIPIYPASVGASTGVHLDKAWLLDRAHSLQDIDSNDKESLKSSEKDKKWKEMAVWGKRDLVSNPYKKWKEMAVWGKRDFDSDVDKRWKEMAVWGKRNDGDSLEKRWKEMAVWGKRQAENDLDKRWKEMIVWGKRNAALDKKWKEMAVWGKRNAELDKRWKEMAVWGKRNDDLNMDKKWKEMAVWGKRNDDSNMDKKWKEMAVWGKRSEDPSMDKKWKEMAVWGKRHDDLDMDKKWKEMAVWGKRNLDPEVVRSWKELQLQWGNKGLIDSEQTGKAIDNLEAPLQEPGVLESAKISDSLLKDEHFVHPGLERELDKRWKEMAVWGKRDPEGTADKLSQWRSEATGILRKKKSSELDRWARVRQRLEQMNRKRPSWSNTGFNSWGKRSDDSVAAVHHGAFSSV